MTAATTLSVEETAAILGVGTSTLRRYNRLGRPVTAGPNELWPIRVAGRVRYGRAAVEAFLAAGAVMGQAS